MATVSNSTTGAKKPTGFSAEALKKTYLHSRVAIIGLVVFLVIGAFVSGILWSDISHENRKLQYQTAVETSERLKTENTELRARTEAQAGSLARAERQIQVDRVAYEELTNALDVSETYINELREELRFYRSIITPDDGEKGLRIHDLSLTAAPEQNRYRYRLVLVQALRHDREVTGDVAMAIEGDSDGETVRHSLNDLGAANPKLSFRYFQILEGDFNTPPGFQPARIRVSVRPKKGTGSPEGLEQWFPWNLSSEE